MATNSTHRRARQLSLGLGIAALAVATVAPVADAARAKTKIMSVRSNGAQSNGDSEGASISANGRYVAFESGASNLVKNDDNAATDVFVHDRKTRKTKRVSVRSNGAEGNSSSGSPSISANGRYVAFTSGSTDLVPFDLNGKIDIFVHDRKTGKTKRVSKSTGGVESDGISSAPSISADGRFVAFESAGENLVSSDGNNVRDVFVHDRQKKRTKRVSVKSNGAQGSQNSTRAAISANGRYVAFTSDSEDLVNGDSNGHTDVFVHDRKKKRTRLVSLHSNGSQPTGDSRSPSISSDGAFIAFWSEAEDLVNGDSNGHGDIFIRDRAKKKTKRVSIANNEAQGNDRSVSASISANGRYVAFESDAENLVSSDSNALGDIFVRDRARGKTKLVSRRNNGGSVTTSDSARPSLSADARFVAFYSGAIDIVPFDDNDADDIFRRGPLR